MREVSRVLKLLLAVGLGPVCGCGTGELEASGAGDMASSSDALSGSTGRPGRPDRLLPDPGPGPGPSPGVGGAEAVDGGPGLATGKDAAVATALDGAPLGADTGGPIVPPRDVATPVEPPPPDAAVAPPPPPATCGCAFGNGRYCAAAARDLEADQACGVALAHEQPDALLRCTDGVWALEQACEAGCDRRPPGEADRCLPQPGVDDGAWHLPWRCGDTYRCTQGNDGDTCGGGVGSHTGRQRFAYDFGMIRGTPIVAARAGEVIYSDNRVAPGQDCYDGCNDGACCDRCINTVNRVVLRHADGTTSLYLHLDLATAAVGAMVGTGEALGVSGTSGCAFGAHLHFQVQADCGIWFCDSMGIDFAENPDMACGAQNASGNCP